MQHNARITKPQWSKSKITRFFLAGLFTCCAVTLEAHAASFMGLGDLPGGAFQSFASGVSGNGTTVVGEGQRTSPSGSEGFRWTNGTGLVGLGDLPGGSFLAKPMEYPLMGPPSLEKAFPLPEWKPFGGQMAQAL